MTRLSPGVQTREIDFSYYVKHLSTSSAGMVGVAERGPINQPVLVTSWEQFVNKFGATIQAGYLAYAARAFFDNGGSVLYVNRIAHLTNPANPASLTAAKASATLRDRRTGEVRYALRVRAANEGTWGNALALRVENGTRDPAVSFNLVVTHRGEDVETFEDLTMDEAASSHAELAVNGRSEYITVEDLYASSGAALDRPRASTFTLFGGGDGLSGLNDADYLGDPSAHTGLYAFDAIDALNLLMAPGVTTPAVIHGGIAYAEGRKDLIFLADAPLHLEPQEAVEFRRGQGTYSHAAFNSSYAALYYPWIEVHDPASGKRKRVPPIGAVAGCFAKSDRTAGVWHAPAGIDRGRVVGALALGYPTSRGERDVLYPEGVNPIVSFPDTGINIWGQKTLQSQPSALDRVNVRRLMIYIEEAIAESSRFVVFEPNNPQTWRALVRLIHPFLEDIRDKGGLVDFAVQCDEETNTPAVIDRNQLIARVFVKPTRTAEFIELHFVLTATGADFREIAEIT